MHHPLRTALDIARTEPLPEGVVALDVLLARGVVDHPALRSAVRAQPTPRGARRAERAVDLADARAESPQESRLRVALVLAGLEPVPQFEVFHGGRFVARVDLAFPEVRLAVEYEGAHHFVGDQILRDDERIERLRAAGWRVIRVTAADLRDLEALITRIRRALVEA